MKTKFHENEICRVCGKQIKVLSKFTFLVHTYLHLSFCPKLGLLSRIWYVVEPVGTITLAAVWLRINKIPFTLNLIFSGLELGASTALFRKISISNV